MAGRVEPLQRRCVLVASQLQGLQRGAAHEERGLLLLHQHPQQQQRGLVGVVQVVREEDHRAEVHDPGQEARQRAEYALSQQGLVFAARRRAFPGQLRQHVGQVAELPLAQSREDSLSAVRPLVEQGHQDARHQVVGPVALLLVARHLDHGVRGGAGEVRSHRLEERALPHSGAAFHEEELALTPSERLERVRDHGELVVASGDARRDQAVECGLREHPAGVHFGCACGLVPSGLLRVIQGGVRRLEQRLGVPSVVGGAGNADAQRDRQRDPCLAQPEGTVPRELQQAVRYSRRFHTRGLGQQQNELVAREPDRDSGRAGQVLEQGGHPGEHLVADVVALRVVDLFEVVQVDEEQ